MLEIARTHGMRVELDAAQIHHPCQARRIVDNNLFGRATRRKRERDGAQPRRPFGWCAFLVERLAFGTVDKTLKNQRTIPNSGERAQRDGKIVAYEIQFGELRLFGKVELIRVCYTDLMSVDEQHLGSTILRHKATTLRAWE